MAPSLQPLDGEAMSFARVALVAHLRGDARFLRDACHEACLTDRVRQRLLAVDVLAGLHREDRHVRVQVIGSRDQDRVDRLLLLEHHSEVFVHRALVVRRLGGVALLDERAPGAAARLAAVVPLREVPLLRRVGEGDDLAVLLFEQGTRVVQALSARPDEGHVHFVARGDVARAAEDVPGHDGEGGSGRGRGGDETPAGHSHLESSRCAQGAWHTDRIIDRGAAHDHDQSEQWSAVIPLRPMPNDVAILGGGFMGVCAALECARRGISVDLYERAEELLTEAGRVSEGKIHLGYVYANDPTLRTARRLVGGAVRFEQCLSRWLDLETQPLELSEPFDYVVLRQSALQVPEIEAHFRRVDDILRETEDALGARYLNRSPDAGVERLTSHEFNRHYDQATIAGAYRTIERSVDTWRLADRLREAVRASARIRVHHGCTVLGVQRSGTACDVVLATDGAQSRQRHASVVNALWGGRLAIDDGLGLLPRRRWLHRYKFGIRLRLRPETSLPPTVTLVHGSFGDVVNFPAGLTYLSWYPAGMVGTSHEVIPPDWSARFGEQARERICSESIAGLAEFLIALRTLPETAIVERHVDGGVIVAWGATDIDDPASELHQRHDIGIHTTGRYHSVDPGKYTMVPMFAVEVCDRIQGGD